MSDSFTGENPLCFARPFLTLEPAVSCVTGRGSKQVNFHRVDRLKTDFECNLVSARMPSKRGGNISLHRCVRLFIPFKFIIFNVRRSVEFLGETALTVDHRSVLKLKSLQVAERFGVPDGI